ncbi:hypothetical protein BDZ45DRAFT_745925 [Acephala macrosclerotiorum]|nr:hypothetical protein BDZ45DRAFT_745925 [Acephala macrosclerotiorum]
MNFCRVSTPYKADCVEAQFGSNHIGHFLLTNLLIPKILTAGPGARIVNLSSNGYQVGEVRFDDYNFSDGKEYNVWMAYAQSKTENILFTVSLAEKLSPKGISAFAVHLGVIWTNLGAHVPGEEWPVFRKTFADRGFHLTIGINKDVAQGRSYTLTAALDLSLESAYLSSCAPEETPEYANSSENAQKLWELSEKIVGRSLTYETRTWKLAFAISQPRVDFLGKIFLHQDVRSSKYLSWPRTARESLWKAGRLKTLIGIESAVDMLSDRKG